MVRKFIEEEFPITELSAIGSKEKSSRFDNISGIHVYWARRPTTVARALILSSLINYPSNKAEIEKIKNLIINACSDYKKISNQMSVKGEIKKELEKAYPKGRIKLLDSFSGGSAIPLEASRIGLDSYGIDLNPVAVLIGKATCEYFQKFSGLLIKEIYKWWNLLKKKLIERLKPHYINPNNKNTILSYIWVRQIKCNNSNCNVLIPAASSLKLVNKKNLKILLKPVVLNTNNIKKIVFKIQKNEEIDFDPKENKIFSDGKVTCPACGVTLTNHETMECFKEKKFVDKLVVIIEKEKKSEKKIYRLANENDYKIVNQVRRELKTFKDSIPQEKLPEREIKWRVQNYGILEWKEFFNDRQMLFNIIYAKELKNLNNQIKESYEDQEFGKAIILYLSFILTRIINYNTKFARWHNKTEAIAATWSRSGLFMKGIYPELNPFTDFSGTPKRYLEFIKNIAFNNLNFSNPAIIKQGNAMNLEFKKNSIDLIITDPPYYDALLYANPSDSFYIWFKRCLEDVFPELFLFSLTPKEEEIIQSRFRHGGSITKAKEFYENSLTKVLMEFQRVLKPDGIGVIMYTHKSVVAWEVLIKALLKSNFVISAAWPIETEKKGRDKKVSLSSSIALVFKKLEKEKTIFFETQFKSILEIELKEKLKKLLVDLEIYGADFFISAIGYSLNIFTRYEKIVSQKTGNTIPVSQFLDMVRKIVNDFLLNTVLEKDVTQNIDDTTNLYIIWCWFFRNNGIPLDDALKLGQSFGIRLEDLRKNKLIILQNRTFKLLLASNKEREKYLMKNRYVLNSLIDHLHLFTILWKNGENFEREIKEIEIKYGDHIWKVGQALAEFFPSNHDEHNYLQGLLARFGKTKTKTDLKKWL